MDLFKGLTRGIGVGFVTLALANCGSAEPSGSDENGGSAGATASGASASGGTGDLGSAGVANGGAAGNAGESSANGGAPPNPTLPVELPAGSREHEGIVNLVDSDAAAQLREFLATQKLEHVALRQGLTKPLNLFLEHYVEAYDFVFFVTDHELDGLSVAGVFEAVNRKALPGGGNDIEIAAGGYKTNGRVKGVIGIPYRSNYYPPFSHEVCHYWAAHLDERFGFGDMLGDADHFLHWGASSVNGQLGGFDPTTLKCETPAGASPPSCAALPTGRTRYVVGAFGPNANGFRSAPYASLELYLMGLLPAADVPESFQLLRDASIIDDSYDPAKQTLIVEASGIRTLPFAEIVARHGKVPLLAESARNFSAAFVVVSATPASDKVLNDVAAWAAVFGNRTPHPSFESFETDTGGRATLNTLLGPRRDRSNPPPAARSRFECNVITQDCGRPELACYQTGLSFCALSGGVQRDQPCNQQFACAPGLDCVASKAAPADYVCKPYCDPQNDSSAAACKKLCPGKTLNLQNKSGQILTGICLP